MIVFAVILYGIEPRASRTLQTLLPSLGECSPGLTWRVLILDNSAKASPCRLPEADERCFYHHFSGNVGLAKAYNFALTSHHGRGASHLVTLDQDSTITAAYLESLFHGIGSMQSDAVALCPIVRSSGRIVSPFSFDIIGFPRYGPGGAPLYAINSMSCYSVAYLTSVGGFDEFYWLDALDLATFARIARAKRKILPLEVEVSHELSLTEGTVNPQRFLNILYYEACYLIEYESPLHWIGGLGRLAGRLVFSGRYGIPVRRGFPAMMRVIAGIARGIERRLRSMS